MIEIPEDINPELIGLAWLRGSWRGTGFREWPGLEKIEFGIQVDFVENGSDYLHYLAQSYLLDEQGAPATPLDMETGFWRAFRDASVEVEMCSPDGFAEIWVGKLQPNRVDLITDAVARTANAKVAYNSGRRIYGVVEGKLMFAFDRSTEEHPLQPYIWATLERA
jgi:hypothetical protein